MIVIQYLGGKSRISKQISEVIIDEISRRKEPNSSLDCVSNRERERERESNGCLISLFCGSCAVESKLAPHFKSVICNDNHKYLVALWQALQDGYELPEVISEEMYKSIRDNKDDNPALTGFVGFGCSFGGKFFGGYARNKTGTNYAAQSKRSILKDFANLQDAVFTCNDYKDVVIPAGSVVYADPPYGNTTGYTSGKFNTEEFWKYMRKISKDNMVFISELNAPDDFKCIWERPFTRTLDRNKNNQFKVVEKLFIHNE